MEYICDTLYSEVVDRELLVVVRECLMEEWSSGDWSAVSVLGCCVMEYGLLVGIRASVTSR